MDWATDIVAATVIVVVGTATVLSATVTVAFVPAATGGDPETDDPPRNVPQVSVEVCVGTVVSVTTSDDDDDDDDVHGSVVEPGLHRQVFLRTLLMVDPGKQVDQKFRSTA